MWKNAGFDTQYLLVERTLYLDWTRGLVDTILHFLYIPFVLHIGSLLKAYMVYRKVRYKDITEIVGISQGGSMAIWLSLFFPYAFIRAYGPHKTIGHLFRWIFRDKVINVIRYGNDIVTKIPFSLSHPGNITHIGPAKKFYTFSFKDHTKYFIGGWPIWNS